MIRLGRPEDLPAIQELVRRAYEHYIARIGRKPGRCSTIIQLW